MENNISQESIRPSKNQIFNKSPKPFFKQRKFIFISLAIFIVIFIIFSVLEWWTERVEENYEGGNRVCVNTCCGCIKNNQSCETNCEALPERQCELINNKCIDKISGKEGEPVTLNLDTSDWQTYRNEEYGFEIKYPKDWKKSEDFSGIIFSEPKPVSRQRVFWQGTFRISISSNSGQLNLNEWIKNFKQESATGANLIRGIIDTTLGGRPAKKASVFAFDGENIETITVDKANVYNLWFEDTNGENDPNNSQHLQIYNQMLSTFRFLDKNLVDFGCGENSRHVFLERNSEYDQDGAGASSDFLIKYKKSSDQIIARDYIVEPGDFEIRDQDFTWCLALTDQFLILDSGTGPFPRGLTVYNLGTRRKVYADLYLRPIIVHNDSINYWSPTNKEVTNENCPKLNTYLDWGSWEGEIQRYVRLDAHVNLNLSDFTKTELGDYSCSLGQ